MDEARFAAMVARLEHESAQAPGIYQLKVALLALLGFVILALLQIYLGGLVAGLDAGMSYNTWPLMDGSLVPDGLGVLKPLWRNLFENPKTVQFVHRCGAYLLLLATLWHALGVTRRFPGSTHARRAWVLFGLVVVQAALGITTLVLQVPLHAALMHQAFALIDGPVLGMAAEAIREREVELTVVGGEVAWRR